MESHNNPLVDAIKRYNLHHPSFSNFYIPLIVTNTLNDDMEIYGRIYKKCICDHYDSNHFQGKCDSCECLTFKGKD